MQHAKNAQGVLGNAPTVSTKNLQNSDARPQAATAEAVVRVPTKNAHEVVEKICARVGAAHGSLFVADSAYAESGYPTYMNPLS